MLCIASSAMAVPMNYTYTGNNYTSDNDSFTTSMNIAGTFTLSSELGTNLVNFNVITLVTAFSVSNGVTVFTEASALVSSHSFLVNTNGAGDITDWWFDFFLASPTEGYGSCTTAFSGNPATLCNFFGVDNVDRGTGGSFGANVIDAPGTWTSSSVPARWPSSALASWASASPDVKRQPHAHQFFFSQIEPAVLWSRGFLM